MKKIPCLFEREFHGRSKATLLRTVTPGCEWVLAGEGIATRKRDGTACLVREEETGESPRPVRLWKRYDAKNSKPAPAGGIPCEPAPDPATGHWPHWVLVGTEPESKWHLAAWDRVGHLEPGTYELCGPHFSPAEGLEQDQFFRHGDELVPELHDRSWDSLRAVLEALHIEGIVFHHPDGRMAKIRRDDYGLAWKPGRR